jgi:hypothetical protein
MRPYCLAITTAANVHIYAFVALDRLRAATFHGDQGAAAWKQKAPDFSGVSFWDVDGRSSA